LHGADFKRIVHEGDFTLPDAANAVPASMRRQLLGMGPRPLPKGTLKGVERGGGR
jgi:hypothetical protein